MYPELLQFQWGDFNYGIGSYSAALIAATIATIVLGTFQALRQGLPTKRVFLVLVGAALASFPGARAWYFATHIDVYLANPSLALSVYPIGLSLAGGVAASAIIGILLCSSNRLPLVTTADAIAPAILFGAAILRLGCFGQGCCFGKPTDLPWGVTFPRNSPAVKQHLLDAPWSILTGSPRVHPVQLYEFLALLLAMCLVLYIPPTNQSGRRITNAALLLATIHGLCLFLRDPHPSSQSAHYIALTVDLVIIMVSSLLLNLQRNRTHCASIATSDVGQQH